MLWAGVGQGTQRSMPSLASPGQSLLGLVPRDKIDSPGVRPVSRVSWSVITHAAGASPRMLVSSHVDRASPGAPRLCHAWCSTASGDKEAPPQGNSKSQGNSQTMHLCLCGQYVTCILVTKITSHYRFL